MHVAIIAATAALGGLLFGYDTGVISGALLFLREAFHLSSLMLGVVTSIALAGAAGGAAGAGLLADRFGRRPVLLATATVFVVGAIVSALAGSLTLLLAGRLLVGISIGGASMLTPPKSPLRGSGARWCRSTSLPLPWASWSPTWSAMASPLAARGDGC